jgi:hypothetical protein
MPGFLFEQTTRMAATTQKALTPVAGVTPKNSQRHAEELTSRSLGYPCYAHGSANIRWFMLTIFKKIFARVANRTDSPTFRGAK